MAISKGSTESLTSFKDSIEQCLEDYTSNYNNLSVIISDINNGAIKGDLADAFKAKFEEKKEMFDGIKQIVSDSYENANKELQSFNGMMDDIAGFMK